MSVDASKTVREVALENPQATRVFEKLGIDYCCGGGKPLREAVEAANLSLYDTIAALEAADRAGSANSASRNWNAEPLGELVEHIVDTHHAFTREELARLAPLLQKVCSVHGKNHPELLHISQAFRGLAQELMLHMMKEEQMLFPYIVRMEEAVLQEEPILPPTFGTVHNPVQMMIQEHDAAGDALHTIREASAGYTPPPDACISYQTLYSALNAFEQDLHQHIHLENNILFPRAVEMEKNNAR